ncbi:hypothetical protein ASG39_06265 [Rhizobium sp. Leaf371]|uniref:SMI1/KNR4 family protein n=1 Tax=Rhizobium sp. Leaf371 TaxID=1736355 RepID=UPI000712B10D|nr:SMI1/KNR4 family protein [Rhizobium sp. Leaf371]KQS67939.1 hypothetical protein ASG39_06265 [Rhizobium sp. Leaf371]
MSFYPPFVIEPGEPSTATFFRGEPHWSNPPHADAALIRATEERLNIVMPNLLRTLYLEQNGGGSDFIYSAIEPGAPLAPAEADFDRWWRGSLPGEALLPLGDLTSMEALQETVVYDPDYSWREHLPEAGRLIRIAGWDEFLCLDYGNGRTEPRVVLFDDVHWTPGNNAPFEAVWPDFTTFFTGLRRPTLTFDEGRPYRGLMPAGPRDQSMTEG